MGMNRISEAGLRSGPNANTGRVLRTIPLGGGPSDRAVFLVQVTADPNVAASEDSEEILCIRPQPFSNHNRGDRVRSGRLPVHGLRRWRKWRGSEQPRAEPRRSARGHDPYRCSGASGTVPPDNPWVGAQDTLPEIWASGLRNPFRFGFDALTGDCASVMWDRTPGRSSTSGRQGQQWSQLRMAVPRGLVSCNMRRMHRRVRGPGRGL